ncbi:MAG: F420-0--gamma-glutamyl ligase [Thermoprotei archaeon]|nr:MAG: F420-0--gamma-glutamyl ligase [Thermoprotei archaeon]RLE56819.1 MAG: F420-0--gamma-glutamyl ligase [Thermoprotei archaeon]
MVVRKLEVFGIPLPEITPGTDLARTIVESANRLGIGIRDGDVIVVTSKVVSKAMGLLVKISDVRPSTKARIIARILGKPAWEVELILRNSKRILGAFPAHMLLKHSTILNYISRDRDRALKVIESDRYLMIVDVGYRVATDAGIDTSNVPSGYVCLPPSDPDRVARGIRDRIRELTGCDVAVILSDTEGSVLRVGSLDIAIGASGIVPVTAKFGESDRFGKSKYGGVDLIADELCATAALLMGQTGESIPVVLIRGLNYERSNLELGRFRVPRGLLLKALMLGILISVVIRFLLAIFSVVDLLRGRW